MNGKWEPDWPVEPDEEPVPLDLLGAPDRGARDDYDRAPYDNPSYDPAPGDPGMRDVRKSAFMSIATELPDLAEPDGQGSSRLGGRVADPDDAGIEPATFTSADFTVERMMRPKPRAPQRGWQRTLYRLSGGRVHPRPGATERYELDRLDRISAALPKGCWRIAVVAIKGGVGKSTSAVMLGHILASLRGDRVVALDANPDAGTLGYRVRRQTTKTVKDLLHDAPRLERFSDMRAYTSQAPSRLEVVASDNDPRVSEAFDDGDYREVSAILERFYSVIVTDCGTGILHSTMRGILDLADQLIVVTAPSLDGGRSASLTLDWLDQHDRRELVEQAVVVINSIRPRGLVDLSLLEDHFRRRCREVVRVPFDGHLEAGAETSLEELMPETRESYLELAAAVGDGFQL